MSLRVLHAATHTHNIGDGALVRGMQSTLRDDLGVDIEFLPIDVLDLKLGGKRTMLTRREYRKVEGDIDLVIVGGGGMIEGNKGSYQSGINFNFDLRILEESARPWVFYALGLNQFPRTHFFHRKRLQRLITLAGARQMPFTVRNDGSATRLRHLLPNIGSVESIPDPGLWVPAGRSVPREIDPDRLNMVVQLAGDRLSKRLRTRRPLLIALAEALERLIVERDMHVVLAPHLLADLELFAGLVALLPNRIVRRSCTMAPVLNGARAAPDFFEIYRCADVAIGMRGHSVICGIGCGTPTIGLGSHAKIGGFLDEVDLADWYVDVETSNVRETIRRRAEAILDDLPAAHERVGRIVTGLREQTASFHRHIAGVL